MPPHHNQTVWFRSQYYFLDLADRAISHIFRANTRWACFKALEESEKGQEMLVRITYTARFTAVTTTTATAASTLFAIINCSMHACVASGP